jgi:hypothetical protein
MALHDRFEAVNDEFLKFKNIESPNFLHPDLMAFVLLAKLVPSQRLGLDLIVSARHDEITLGTDCTELNEAASDEDILTLVRCGVRYCAEHDCLEMFV